MRDNLFRFGACPQETKALFHRMAPSLSRIALYYTKDEEAAKDIVQATWERALAKRATYQEHKGSIEAWVTGICRNACRDWARRNRQRPADEAKWAIEHGEILVRDLEKMIIGRRARSQVLKVVRREFRFLSPKERDAIELRIIAGIGPSETALAMGVSQSTVRSHLSEGLRKLRIALDRAGVA